MRSHNNGTTHIVMDIWGIGYEDSLEFKMMVRKLAREYTNTERYRPSKWYSSEELDQLDV